MCRLTIQGDCHIKLMFAHGILSLLASNQSAKLKVRELRVLFLHMLEKCLLREMGSIVSGSKRNSTSIEGIETRSPVWQETSE